MARAPALFFGLQLPDTIVYNRSEAFVDFNYLFILTRSASGVKVIRAGVHIYICLWTKKKFESYFSDRLTFLSIRSGTSRQIYGLALPLYAPETLSSLSKSRISIFGVRSEPVIIHEN